MIICLMVIILSVIVSINGLLYEKQIKKMIKQIYNRLYELIMKSNNDMKEKLKKEMEDYIDKKIKSFTYKKEIFFAIATIISVGVAIFTYSAYVGIFPSEAMPDTYAIYEVDNVKDIYTVIVENKGDAIANNLRVKTVFPSNMTIIDKVVSTEETLTKEVGGEGFNYYNATYELIQEDETITITLYLENAYENMNISVEVFTLEENKVEVFKK